MSAWNPFSGILFDHDGVLVASEPLHWAAWKALFDEIKIPFDEPLIKSLVGLTSPEILRTVLKAQDPTWNSDSPANAKKIIDLSHRKNDIYVAIAREGLQPYPGVLECIEKLHKKGIKMGVVSNARNRELELSLNKTNLIQYFNSIVSRESGVPPKPASDPYLLGAAELGLSPSDCLAFEDSPPGLAAALLAKTQAFGVLTNFSSHELKTPVPGRPDLQPLALFNNLEEALLSILSSL